MDCTLCQKPCVCKGVVVQEQERPLYLGVCPSLQFCSKLLCQHGIFGGLSRILHVLLPPLLFDSLKRLRGCCRSLLHAWLICSTGVLIIVLHVASRCSSTRCSSTRRTPEGSQPQ